MNLYFDYNILDYIFPPACGICGKLGEGYICENCYKIVEKYFYQNIEDKQIKNNTNEIIKNKTINTFYLLQYRDIIRDKMIEYKFNDKSYLYRMFCEIFVKNKLACEFIKNYDIIIPVPMYKKKKAIRGYNQSELIARKLAKYFKMPIVTKVLIKQVNTQMQSSLGKRERIKNVQNVYKIQYQEKIKDKNVLLVDDIYTTGATVKECKKMLQFAGSKNIGTIIIAKD